MSVFYGVWESADPRRLIYRLCSPLVTMALLSWSGGCFCFVTTSCVSFPMFGSFTDTEESRSWACFKGEKERPPARICVWLGAGRLLSRGVWAGSPGPGRGSWTRGQNTQSPDDARLEEPRAESHPVGPALPQISFSRHLTAFCPKPPGERKSFSPGQERAPGPQNRSPGGILASCFLCSPPPGRAEIKPSSMLLRGCGGAHHGHGGAAFPTGLRRGRRGLRGLCVPPPAPHLQDPKHPVSQSTWQGGPGAPASSVPRRGQGM